MKPVEQTVLMGMRNLYSEGDRIVLAYQNHRGDYQFMALWEGDEPPERHRLFPSYWLVGPVDLATGRVREWATEPDGEADNDDGMGIDWWGLMVKVGNGILMVCVAGAFFLLALAAAFGTSGRGRGRH